MAHPAVPIPGRTGARNARFRRTVIIGARGALIAAVLLAWSGAAALFASTLLAATLGDELRALHERERRALAETPWTLPFLIESQEDEDTVAGVVFGVLDARFDTLREQLALPGAWCELALLQLNVKACVREARDGVCYIRLYVGRSFYQTPDAASPLEYRVRSHRVEADSIALELEAAEGPFGTRDYLIRLEAAPVQDDPGRGGTLVRFRYSYAMGGLSRLGLSLYLSTLGAGKVGFTAIPGGAEGRPQLVRGRRGIVERNVARYYLALQAFAETAALDPERRDRVRFERWFELTELLPRQLHELERQEYLAGKWRERTNQAALQRRVPHTAACDTPSGT